MRIVRIVSAFCILCATSVLAQEAAPEHAPHLVVDEPAYDFGTLDSSEAAEHTYVLRNDGDTTLEISQVRPSCGCTVASITERSVPPGGESRVTARLNLQGRSGAQHKTITVESNDPSQPQFTLTLSGVVGTAIDVQPSRLMLGQIAANTKPAASIQLIGNGTPFNVTDAQANSDKLTATIETVETGRIYKVNVAATEPLEAGQLDGVVVIHTDHPQKPTIEVPVTFIVVGEVVVAPRELVFPEPSTEAVTRYVIVRTGEGSPFEIQGIEPPDPSITVAVEPFGPNGYKVQLNNVVASADMNGKVLKIHTSLAGSQEIDVPLRVMQPLPAPGT